MPTFMHLISVCSRQALAVLSSVRKGDYAFKIDLQDAYFHVPIHPSSRKYLRFAFENKVYQFRSEHSPSGFYSFGAHGDRLPAPSRDLGDTISRRLVNSKPRPSSFIPTSSSANKYARPCQLYSKQKEIRAGPDPGSPVSRNAFTSGLGGSFPSKAREIVARARHLSSLRVLTYTQVSQLMRSLNWASALIPLGNLYLRPLQRHFHSLGLTDWFTATRRSDPLVLANLLWQWQDPRFLTSGFPIRTFQADFMIFTEASVQGWGAHMGDSKISGTWTWTASSISIAWSSKQSSLPYSIGLLCFRATRL